MGCPVVGRQFIGVADCHSNLKGSPTCLSPKEFQEGHIVSDSCHCRAVDALDQTGDMVVRERASLGAYPSLPGLGFRAFTCRPAVIGAIISLSLTGA